MLMANEEPRRGQLKGRTGCLFDWWCAGPCWAPIALHFHLRKRQNDFMSAFEKPPTVDPQIQADHEAAERYALERKPFPPDLARRIRERAERARARTGRIDVDKLIHDARNEA